MRVRSDHERCSSVDGGMSELHLNAVGHGLALGSPVEEHHDDLRFRFFGSVDVVHHLVFDASAFGQFVRSDERNLHAFHVQLRDAIIAEGRNAHGLDRFDGVGLQL